MNAADAGHLAWFRKAEHNLLSIRNNLGAAVVPWDNVVFDGQQAAEKYLKGFIVLHGGRPPKIHDLSRLLDLAVAHDSSLESLRSSCIALTDAGYQSRYPGIADELGELQARDAVTMAEAICAAIRERTRNP